VSTSSASVIRDRRPPALVRPADARYDLGGVVGERVWAAVEGWLLPAPEANPALTEMFHERDLPPARALVPWAGEFVGKHLLSSILVWRLVRDERLRAAIDRVVARVLDAQEADGYLGPFPEDVRLVEKWDVWGQYHLILAFLAYCEEGLGEHAERALAAARRMADLFHRFFAAGNRRMLTSDDADGEKNYAVIHAVVRLYRLTGEERYRELAAWIEAEWDKPPTGQYLRSALAGMPIWQFPAHRWESIHDIQGIAELAFLTGDERYERAFRHIWWSILEGDRHNTGGFTSGEACQGNPYDPRAIETCCTMAWIALSVDMLRMTGDPRVADEIELATLNGMIGGQHPSGRWWTYTTPMDGERHACAHDIVFQARAGSPELNCCSVNAPRGLGMIGDWALLVPCDGDGIVLDYYGPCALSATLASGRRITLHQETAYPLDGDVAIRVDVDEPAAFPLRLRIPAWSARTSIVVNDAPVADVAPGTYLGLERRWRPGDVIRVEFDFSPHVWVGDRESAGKASLYRGPILLAFDPRYGSRELDLDHLPQIDLGNLRFEPIAWDGPFPPWLLVRAPTADGRSLVLCDFASAGATGQPYRSWLPAVGAGPAPFSRDHAIWARRVA